ncbi:hypothetical protein [Luteitalea sp.]
MTQSMPAPGDFVVQYRHSPGSRGAARIVVVYLTPDAGPEELFSSATLRGAQRAEDLAALWALQDGSHAWRSGHGGMAGERPQRIGFASSRAR